MSEIKFIKFNGIKEYARVMYNDVKDADKYKIDVAYNGRDVKHLLEYLFDIESQLQQKENIIEKVREYIEEMQVWDYEFNEFVVQTKELLELLDKEIEK